MTTIDPFNQGPIAPERNPPINPEYYQPSRFQISDITLGKTTLVTTNVDHNYVVGQSIRLLIPQYYGAQGLNYRQGVVISIPEVNEVIVQIDSRGMQQFGFIGPDAPNKKNFPQIIALGDVNSGAINASGRVLNGTFIEGSFIDVS